MSYSLACVCVGVVAVKAPASDDEEPPCLPERTPESFVLPTGTERQLPRDPTPTENGT